MEERKQAEGALKRGEQKKETILNSLMEHVIYEDTAMKILWANQVACESAGLPFEELIGRHCYEIWPKRSTPCPDCPVVKAMKTGQPQEVEKTTPDGRSWFIRGYPIRDTNGDVTGAVEVTLEITERKKAEELYRSVVELSPESIITVDTKGVITSCNPAATRMLGYSKDEMIGKHFSKIGVLREGDLPKYLKLFVSVLRGKVTKPLELTFYRKDETPLLAEVRVSLLKEGDKTIGLQAISRDITERKQMEEALRKSEEKFRNIFENANDAMIYLDKSGRILGVNRKAVEVFGGSKKELLGKNFAKVGVFSPRDIPTVMTVFGKVLAGEPATLNVCIENKKGQEIPLEGSASLMKVDDEVVTMVIARDVTERKKVEKALKESEQKLRDIIDTSPDAIVWVDTTGKITLVSRKVLELTGFLEKDFIGKNFMDIEALTQESKKRIFEGFVKRIEGIDTPPYEVEIVTRNGEVIPAELSASLIFEEGEVVGTQSILRDLRERKKMERKLQEYAEHLEEMVKERTKELRESQDQLKKSEEMYRLLVENSNDGISIVDFEGKIIFANRKLKEMYGYEEMEGMSIAETIHPDVKKEVIEEIQKAATNEEINDNAVVKVLRKDGSPFWIETNATFVKENGKPVGFLAVSRDITERKRMEERLLKSKRLAAIGEVATMVGHDLRNPLQSIENATYYLNNELPHLIHSTPIPQKTLEMLRVLNDSVNYADKIMRDLQDFSASKKPMLKQTDINAIAKETLSQVKTPENVKLTTELNHLPKIKADKDMIKRVFLNLAINGIQAMEKGGILKVSTKKMGGFVEVSFRDTGIGMSKENMKKIFIPFFTTKAKGMGMGLPVCKKLVDAHGGSIKVESEEGKGTTFTVKLPIPQENGGDNQ